MKSFCRFVKYSALASLAIGSCLCFNLSEPAAAQEAPGSAERLLANMPMKVTQWEDVCGAYVRSDSSQCTNGTILLKEFSMGIIFFQIDFCEGNETDGCTAQLRHSGFLTLDKNNVGRYTSEDKNLSLIVELSEHADTARVKVDSVKPKLHWDCKFNYEHRDLALTAESAKTFLEELPTAATGLNSFNQGYKVIEAGDTVGDDEFFYPFKVFSKDGKLLGKYWFLSDLYTVYRVDPDFDKPVVVYGTPIFEVKQTAEKYFRKK
ncbi:hypothetical protein IJT93_05300 [bacterium]|nr:hypothetical protein [bacterium]